MSSLDRPVGAEFDLLAIYYAHHTRINSVARRLVAAGSPDTPVLLSAPFHLIALVSLRSNQLRL